MLKNLLRFARKDAPGEIGFSYVARDADSPMQGVEVGVVVDVGDGAPPWIVVDEAPTTAIVARWPGRLWKVEILRSAPAKDQPMSYARYKRALAVRVLDEVSTASLFGEHGHQVSAILEIAASLSRESAASLSPARHPRAPEAYDQVFRSWIQFEDLDLDFEGSLDGVLKVGSKPHGSPIYDGLCVLDTVVSNRAKAVEGDAANSIEDGEVILREPWRGACTVLSDAALALGAPSFVTDENRKILLSGWDSFST
ncbi:MAG: hypothetical protein ABL928_00430 [Sphingorhabdus sp.]